jgi:hypothetical protein
MVDRVQTSRYRMSLLTAGGALVVLGVALAGCVVVPAHRPAYVAARPVVVAPAVVVVHPLRERVVIR